MFPDTLEDIENNNIAINMDKTTSLARLALPSQMLKTAVLHLINYQVYVIFMIRIIHIYLNKFVQFSG